MELVPSEGVATPGGQEVGELPTSGGPEGETTHDLCMAWITEHDAGFVELLDEACRARGLSMLQVTPANVEQICEDLEAGRLKFRALFDRAGDEDRDFLPIINWAIRNRVYRINPIEQARLTWDKAGMHTALCDRIPVPYTIYIPSHNDSPELPRLDLSPLGPSFTIKPAHGGGGYGVVVVATTMDQVLEARQTLPDDMYMLQARIVPGKLDGRVAWFRNLYAAGEVYPCWWDFDSKRYIPVSVAEESHYKLAPLREMTEEIACAVQLELFSNEIAIDVDGRFVVVDYVNDPIDLTLASRKPDGPPDQLVRFIAENLAGLVAENVKAGGPAAGRASENERMTPKE